MRVTVAVAVSEPLELIVSVCVVVLVRVEVLDAVTGLFDGLNVGDLLTLGDREGEATFERVTVASLVGDTVFVIDRVSERVILGDFDSDDVIETVLLGEAIAVCDAVVDRVSVLEMLEDFDSERLWLVLPDSDGDTEVVAASVFVTVRVADTLLLPETVTLGTFDTEGLNEPDFDSERLWLVLPDSDGDTEVVAASVFVTVRVADTLLLPETVTLGTFETEGLNEPDFDSERLRLILADSEGDTELVAASDLERVDVTEFVLDWDELNVLVLEAERDDDTAFDTDGVRLILTDSERLIEALADSEDDTEDDAA